jgi:uncharacterized protein YbjT (DUF2867 family)
MVANMLDFFEMSGRNLLTAEAAHHVALSVVGADRLPASGYMRAKIAQETLIKKSSIPYTIVRATQFFEFMGGIANSATDGQTVRLPSALMQPILSDAALLADVALAEPLNGTLIGVALTAWAWRTKPRSGSNTASQPQEMTTQTIREP